jgi:hypothetical protein
MPHESPGARRSDRDEFATGQFQITAEDDLMCPVVVSQGHVRQPDERPLWMWPDPANLAHTGSGDTDDHRDSIT